MPIVAHEDPVGGPGWLPSGRRSKMPTRRSRLLRKLKEGTSVVVPELKDVVQGSTRDFFETACQ
jgi:hypothetical protein